MKKKPSATEWASPQGILKNVGKRPLVLASKEENEEHFKRLSEPGTPENIAHHKVMMRRR